MGVIRESAPAGIDTAVPSLAFRTLLSLALLGGFVLTTLGLAIALLVAPVVFVWLQTRGESWKIPPQTILIFACTWIPAFALLRGLFLRPPRFVPPERQLSREEAPELFEILEQLATTARTLPPADVFLSPLPTLAVTEHGGFFGLGGRRVLILGTPLLAWLSVQELRAGLAHEIGHFLGGETRLSGVISYTHALFRSVLVTAQSEGSRHPFVDLGRAAGRSIATLVVLRYANLYRRLMNPLGQRLELAADRLAARLSGRAATVRALEIVCNSAPLYEQYLATDVAEAVGLGGMPLDLLEGFEAVLAEAAHASEGTTAGENAHDPLDTHPPLADRLEAVRSERDVPVAEDPRAAMALFADPTGVARWTVETTRSLLQGSAELPVMPWADLPRRVLAPCLVTRASRIAEEMRKRHPAAHGAASALVAAVDDAMAGHGIALVLTFEPGLGGLAPVNLVPIAKVLLEHILATLFIGALLDGGAELKRPTGQPDLLCLLQGEEVVPERIAREAMTSDSAARELQAWSRRLLASQRFFPPRPSDSPHAGTCHRV